MRLVIACIFALLTEFSLARRSGSFRGSSNNPSTTERKLFEEIPGGQARSPHEPHHHISSMSIDEETFYHAVDKTKSDKVHSHYYSDMYGQYLVPYIRKKHQLLEPERRRVKFLEIGLGCGMSYGAGQSVKIWRELLQVEFDSVWEADYDIHCVEKNKNHVSLQDIHLLAGDQSDFKVLDEWIKKSGGEFDIVIDDGSHQQHMIYNSFVKLWPQVVSGGVYFIEDLQVAYRDDYADTSGRGINMIEVIQAWMEQLVLTPENIQKKDYTEEKRLPKDIRMISCQAHACVILKCFKNPGIGDLSYCS